jgi:predicted NBD/HSP70 family sugar kinase
LNATDIQITDRHRATRNRIFRLLLDSDLPHTKQAIAGELGLSMPTVLQSLAELSDMGLVSEAGYEPSTGGRPAMQLAIESNARLAIGVQVTGHHFRLIETNLSRQELATKTIRHELARAGERLGRMIAKEVDDFVEENHIDRDRLLGVGVAIPGIIDEKSDTITHASTMNLVNTPLGPIRDAIPYHTLFGNDANLGGFAEWCLRPTNPNIAYLSLESGVGGAVLINGATYVGDHGRSGEFGHICVEPGGRECDCGKRGCLQAYCSTRCLSDDLDITLEEFFAALDAGEVEATEVWESYVTHLARGIHAIRMALDCEVVLGGGIVHFLQPHLDEIRGRVAELDSFGGDGSYVSLSYIFRHATQLGAALMCIEEFAQGV